MWGAMQVAPYKKVRKVAFIDEIPKSAAEKVLRLELVQAAAAKARLQRCYATPLVFEYNLSYHILSYVYIVLSDYTINHEINIKYFLSIVTQQRSL